MKLRQFLLLILAVAVLAAGAYASERAFLARSPVERAPSATRSAATTETVQTSNTTLIAGDDSYRLYVPSGSTVLDAMRTLASTTSFVFSGREYPSLGFFVESINGKRNADGLYWFLYINGASSDTGVSNAVLHPGDTVEWRYERDQYIY